MELETVSYHSDAEDGYNLTEDNSFSFVLGPYSEKCKDLYPFKSDRNPLQDNQCLVQLNSVFRENIDFLYHPSSDLVVISSLNKSPSSEESLDKNLDSDEDKEIATLLKANKKELKAMTSSDIDGNEDFFPWTNELKVALDHVKSDEESTADGSFDLSDSSNASAKKRKIWEVEESVKRRDGSDEEQGMKKLKEGPERKEESFGIKQNEEGGGSRMPPWQVDEIEDMAADLDSSFSGLGTDLTTGSYNMSEALLSLPSLTVFKQEAPSPSHENFLGRQGLQQNMDESHDQNSTLHRLLQQQNYHSQVKRNNAVNSHTNNKINEGNERRNDDCRFQYILAAATSIATKVTEETLTYLNQGQSYEIKLKKIGELSNYRGKVLKSVIRICFHERRLQYMEKEQILAWQASRPGERIVELDVPLSYGLFDVEQDPNMLNTLSFLWDPTKEVGAYIKVNCISTEFTPKKHGGEKGVPFRIQVETFIDGDPNRLHAAACQIKVFKLKGADRKHKQDREKILKRPPSEQEKYQPSYECTVLTDLQPEAVFPAPNCMNSSPSGPPPTRPNSLYSPVDSNDSGSIPHNALRAHGNNSPKLNSPGKPETNNAAAPDRNIEKVRSPVPLTTECPTNPAVTQLTPECNTQQTAQWLRKNSFGNYISTFANFTGADILRLTRDDLIQICGLADGIRLLYALHSKAIVRLTLYFCTPGSGVFHAVYLDQIGRNEVSRKLAALLGVHQNQIHDIYLQGPNNIRVLITDEVVNNIKDESMFSIEVLKDENRERFLLLLKPATAAT